jgi:6-phosphogluconate dehydrogenase (decarboxylating)
MGVVGRGQRGGNISPRLMKWGHTSVVWDANQVAVEDALPTEVLAASMFTRCRVREQHTFAEKELSAMRLGFGGDVEPGKK